MILGLFLVVIPFAKYIAKIIANRVKSVVLVGIPDTL
jgi:hypothetical protein